MSIKCCCKYSSFIFYIIIILACSFLTIIFTMCLPLTFQDYSNFKNDEIFVDGDYYPISNFPNLEKIYKNYSNNIYYQIKYDFSKVYNFTVISIFTIMKIIININFICCNYNKARLIVFDLLTFLVQVAALGNKIYSDLLKRKLPKLEEEYIGELIRFIMYYYFFF